LPQKSAIMLGPKKFKIKKWDNPSKKDPGFPDDAWAILADAMDRIFAKRESSLSFEVLYRNAYFMVIHRHGQRLHDGMAARLRAQLTAVAAGLPPPPIAAARAWVVRVWVYIYIFLAGLSVWDSHSLFFFFFKCSFFFFLTFFFFFFFFFFFLLPVLCRKKEFRMCLLVYIFLNCA
jgi:hypothetical protein